MPRIALITGTIPPYRVSCFRKLSELIPEKITFFLLPKHPNNSEYAIGGGTSPFEVRTLKTTGSGDYIRLDNIQPVLSGNFDVIIIGGLGEPSSLLLRAWAKAKRKKILFWVKAAPHSRSGWSYRFKRFLFRSASCIVAGKRTLEYCCHQLGVPRQRIFIAPNAVDRVFFREKADSLLHSREARRAETGLNGLVVLFAGRLLEESKGVSDLIRACGRLEREAKRVSLLLAGDGPDRSGYQELARGERLSDIRFLGMLNQEDLCEYYSLSDVLVLPSRYEPWGFVLNEGMEFGLPLVVSRAVGAGPDLVRPGRNGYVFRVGDIATLTRCLEAVAQDKGLRKRMGEESRMIIQDFSPENWAKGVFEAVNSMTDAASLALKTVIDPG